MPQAAPEPTGGRLTPVLAWLRERTRRLRQRVPLVDHGWRATEHYVDVQGSLLAAAVTYYGFLSIFPLLALAFGAVGLVARMVPDAKADLERALQEIVPGVIGNGPHQLSLATLEGTATTAAGLGALAVFYSGVSWMSDVREGLTTIFRVPRQDQPNVVVGYLRALASLVQVGGILLASLGISAGLTALSRHLPEQHATVRVLLASLSVVTGIAVSSIFFHALFRRAAPADLPRGALWSGAALGAMLFEILKQLSGRLLASTSSQPAFQAFGISLILLVWIYYFSRIVMFATSWAATAPASSTRTPMPADETLVTP